VQQAEFGMQLVPHTFVPAGQAQVPGGPPTQVWPLMAVQSALVQH